MVEEVSAYHESGHALMAALLGGIVRRITIEPEWDDGPDRYGDTKIEWNLENFSRKDLQKRFVQVALAGPAAEMIHTGDPFHPGLVPQWSSDWRIAWESAAELVPDEKKRLRFLETISVEIYHSLKQDHLWAALGALVDQLLAHETLEREEIEEVLATWLVN